MSSTSSKFWSKVRGIVFKPANKTIGEATGKSEPGGAVENPPAGSKGGATFRQMERKGYGK